MIPLSFGQQRLWLLDRFEGAGWAYNMVIHAEMRGPLDTAALDAAVSDVLARHEALRTRFPDLDGTPQQEIVPAVPELRALTLAGHTAAEDREAALRTYALHEFDLAREIPFKAVLLATGPDEHVLYLVMHHIAVDGWSVRPLLRDLAEAYTARRQGRAPGRPPLDVQFADYAQWQRDVLGTADDPQSLMSEQLDFWRSALAGMPQEIAVPADRPRPRVTGCRGGAVDFTIDARLHGELLALARESKATLSMVVHAAVAALFTRLGAGEDIPLGTGVAGRSDEALDDLVGFFINTLALRTDVSGDPTFRELIGRVRAFDLAAFDQQEAPFDQVVEALAPQRVPGRHPLFQAMLLIQDDYRGALDFAGLEVESGKTKLIERLSAKFDLYFDLNEAADGEGAPAGIAGELKYAADLWDESSARSMAERLVRLLRAMTADPDLHVSQADLLSEEERRRLTAEWTGAAPPVTAGQDPALDRLLAGLPDGARLAVLDDRLGLLPPGVPGDLYAAAPRPRQGPAPHGRTGPPPRGRPDRTPVTRTRTRPAAPGATGPGRRRRRDGPAPHGPPGDPLRDLRRDARPRLGRHPRRLLRTGRPVPARGPRRHRVRTVFGVELDLSAVFRSPTVARLDARMAGSAQVRAELGAVTPRPSPLPASPAQQRLWMLDRIQGTNASCNIPIGLRLHGAVDAEALEAAVHDVVVRHEVLRTVLRDHDGLPHQRLLPPDRARIPLDRAGCTPEELPSVLMSLATSPFDLAEGPLLRATLIALAPEEHVLLLLVHHVACDGWSQGPLLRDLSTAYGARCAGAAPPWEPLPVQYADYALWQRELLGDAGDADSPVSRQLAHWERVLEGMPDELVLPMDRPRPDVPSFEGGLVPVRLDAALHRSLAELARSYDVTMFMALHAGLAVLLSRLGAGTDVPVGTVVAGRTDEALDELVGFFVNTLVLRADLSGDPSVGELLGRVRETDLAAFEYQGVEFERLVERLNPVRRTGSEADREAYVGRLTGRKGIRKPREPRSDRTGALVYGSSPG